VDALFKAIEARNAYDFARRPLDFLNLCGDWKEHGAIQCHRDQISSAIDIRLRKNPKREERKDLSGARARGLCTPRVRYLDAPPVRNLVWR